MSNYGQAALTIVGTVVGAYFGYPQLGFVLGSLAGQALFPTQLPDVTGPRLDDLRTTTSVVGSPVIITYGTIAVPGTIIWIDDVVEHSSTEEVGGKGAPEQDVTTFSYTQSIAIGLCEGPIAGVIRIWENGKLVFDIREQQVDESDSAYEERIEASAEYATTFTLYLGTTDQEPDPTIEADKGVGRVPAFRGLAYIVYPDRQLKDDQGRRHPNFKFEISNCAGDFAAQIIFTSSGTWTKPAGLTSATVLCIGGGGGAGSGAVGLGGSNKTGGKAGGGGGASSATFNADSLPSTVSVIVGSGGAAGASLFKTQSVTQTYGNHGSHGGDSSFGGLVTAQGGRGGRGGEYDTPEPGGSEYTGLGGTGTTARGGNGSGNPAGSAGPGESTTAAPAGAGEVGKPAGAGGGSGGGGANTPGTGLGGDGGNGEEDLGSPSGAEGGSGGRITTLPFGSDGSQGENGGNGHDSLIYHGGGGGGGGRHPVAGANTIGGNGGDGGRYGGGGGGGGAANAHGSGSDNGISGRGGAGGNGIVIVLQTFEGSDCSALTLADVVTDICLRAGLVESDINVVDLNDVEILGYAITRPMPARAAIDPLRSVGFFDVVETQGILKFVTRGQAYVATLEDTDLAAHDYASDGSPPAVTVKKIQDVELPRLVRVHYLAASRDYEAGEQVSPSRISTEAVNDSDVELAVALDDDHAAQIAEVLWADAWQSRWGYEIAVDAMHWLELDPSDVIRIPVDDRLIRARIVSGTIQAGEIMPLALCRDDDGSYESEAVAQAPERPPAVIVVYPPTEMILLDLPALRDEDNDAGFYAACCADGAGTWLGAVIARSIDGITYGSPFANVVNAATIGTIVSPSSTGITTTWDDANSITVDVRSGSLESRPDVDILLGANAAAIGSHGRWQIIQFGLAELISEGRYRLSHLLQGRKGTEYLVGQMLAGDNFVLISGAGIVRIPLDQALIGTEMTYRAVTAGTPASTGVTQVFAGTGEALETFSPVYVEATLSGSDIVITWIRRGRLSQELRSGADIPLSEASESYSIDIYDASSPDVLVRTLTSSTQTVTYTAAQIASDFSGSPLPSIRIEVFQLSAIVGRGTPGVVFI